MERELERKGLARGPEEAVADDGPGVEACIEDVGDPIGGRGVWGTAGSFFLR
jgi:hypothetical protein